MNSEHYIKRFDELIARGIEILKTRRDLPSNYIGFDDPVDSQLGNQWMVSSKNILIQAMGETGIHYIEFGNQFKKGVTFSPVKRGIGILQAAKDDFENGYLRNARKIVSADIASSMLDQADELLKVGYIGPAAVIIGCILEEKIRKMCDEHTIELPDKPKLDFMNSLLAKAEIYNKLTQKQITAYADIRNSAAHGKWNDFTKENVQEMYSWVQRFLENH